MSKSEKAEGQNYEIGDKTSYEQEEEEYLSASQWELIARRFRKHKLAVTAIVILSILYLSAIFAPFFSPNDPRKRSAEYKTAPPRAIHFVSEDGFHIRPFVYDLEQARDPETLEITYTVNKEKRYPINFLVHGYRYKLFGVFPTDLHLFGTGEDVPVFIFGTDTMGRDLFARILYGARVSLSVGLVGVAISLFLGILIGGFAGYYGGWIDEIVQRLIELLISIPKIPLWMGFAAALPKTWSTLQMYFAITVILSLIGWTGLARIVRGKFLSLREEDFVTAARLAGRSELAIIFRHMVPSFLSHIIASLTLSIPSMILGETALSFLGIGLKPPVISWGVLLQKAQNVQTVAMRPWLLIPGLFVILTVISFNFLGDGLRDAADPYSE